MNNRNIQFSQEQLEAINCNEKYILVKARAGSGKTAVLVERAKRLLKKVSSPDQILILAFNKKASLEINLRIRFGTIISRLISIGKKFKNARTFHSFASSIIRPNQPILHGRKLLEFLQLLILEKRPKISKDIGNDEISQKRQQLPKDQFICFIRNHPNISFTGEEFNNKQQKWIADFLFEYGINIQFKKEHINIIHNNGEIQIKRNKHITDFLMEYGLTKQKAKLYLIEPFPLNIGTKNRKKFEKKLKDKLEKIGVRFGKKLNDDQIYEKLKETLPTIYKITELINSFITQAKQNYLSPDDLDKKIERIGHNRKFFELANTIYQIYKNRPEIDFSDILHQAIEKIQYQDIANLKYILIDEFQDFSPLFHKLIDKIRTLKPDIEIFAVGDDWQSINGFAGANIDYFRNFSKYFPNSKILEINTNYRSRNWK